MKASIKDTVKGKAREVKGKVKEKIGKATNNPNLEAEGRLEKVSGKIQKKIGQVEKAFRRLGGGVTGWELLLSPSELPTRHSFIARAL